MNDTLKQMQDARHFIRLAGQKDISEQERLSYIGTAQYHLQRAILGYTAFGLSIAQEVQAQTLESKNAQGT